MGALVNGRIVPLDTQLKNGDIVEILTSKTSMPKLGWLGFVKTKTASSKIHNWYKKNKRQENIEIGKEQLENALTKAVFDELAKNGEMEKCAIEMNYKTEEDLYAGLGYGETTIHKILNKLKRPPQVTRIGQRSRKSSKKDDISGLEGLLWNIAKCCSPLPGEPIVGVITRSRGVSVHRKDCKSLAGIEPERLMDIKWADEISSNIYEAHIRIESQDRIGLLKDIVGKISDTDTNITYTKTYTKNRKVVVLEMGLALNDISILTKVMANIQSLPDIYSVKRLEQKTPEGGRCSKKNFHKKR